MAVVPAVVFDRLLCAYIGHGDLLSRSLKADIDGAITWKSVALPSWAVAAKPVRVNSIAARGPRADACSSKIFWQPRGFELPKLCLEASFWSSVDVVAYPISIVSPVRSGRWLYTDLVQSTGDVVDGIGQVDRTVPLGHTQPTVPSWLQKRRDTSLWM